MIGRGEDKTQEEDKEEYKQLEIEVVLQWLHQDYFAFGVLLSSLYVTGAATPCLCVCVSASVCAYLLF